MSKNKIIYELYSILESSDHYPEIKKALLELKNIKRIVKIYYHVKYKQALLLHKSVKSND